MTKAQILLKVLTFTKIIHHTKGRLRLDISSKITEDQDLKNANLDELFKIKGVKDVKINKILGKVTINYDADILDSSRLDDLLNATCEADVLDVLKELNIDA